MRHAIRIVSIASIALAVSSTSVQAQAQGDVANQQNAPAAARRQQLEQQLRQGLWRIAKERLALTDEQMTQLEETSKRFAARRRALALEERAHRMVLRDEILANDKADQARVAKALDGLIQIQRDRVELQAQEQREFATFMTPIQRAKYAALQEEVRRRIEALRRQRPDSAPASDAR